MILVVGLGNPGPQYSATRHNIGFELIDSLSEAISVTGYTDRGIYLTATGRFRGTELTLVKPLTYMNRSGSAVKKALVYSNASPENCLICYDDINLPVGTIRLRPRGSAGGHNGIADIIGTLGTDHFPRLRIGIGNDFGRGRQSEYVLSPFTPDQQRIMDETLPTATEAVLTFIHEGVESSMNRYN
ncbi:MAG: aminoacyl-tRNA hydrolase [Balneolaceae bacterium]